MYRLSVPLPEDERAEWRKFTKKEGYGSMAQMVRSCVRGKIKNDATSPFEKQIEGIKIMFGSITEGIEKTKEWMEFLDMRLNIKEGNSEIIYTAAREIQKILLNEEPDLSTVIKRLNKYDKETLNAAIILLYRLDRVGTYRKRGEKNEIQEKCRSSKKEEKA